MQALRLLAVVLTIASTASAADSRLVFSCIETNDVYVALARGGVAPSRFATAAKAVERAPRGGAVLVLADEYPAKRVAVDEKTLGLADEKQLRLYLEFPSAVPGVEFAPVRHTGWERIVVATDSLGPSLPKLAILSAHGCDYLPSRSPSNLLAAARVAGFDSAVYGLPKDAASILFEMHDGRWFIATTKLSSFVTGRFAPADRWAALWRFILRRVGAESAPNELKIEPLLAPAYGADEKLPANVEHRTFDAAASWYPRARLLVHPSRRQTIEKALLGGTELLPGPAKTDPPGDGSLGILEGYGSQVQPDGSQLQRTPLRSDCNAESAMVLAIDAQLNHHTGNGEIARNLLDFIYFKSGICQGVRGDPHHPSFGLIAWGDISPAWLVANYGDDDARTILATLAASSALGTDRWDKPMVRSLLANLRTTGTRGFRGDRIDVPALEQNGWKHFRDAPTINPSPHFEGYLWACNLWAYARTGDRAFLDRTEIAIRATMDVYPKGWRWGDNMERSRMLLPLAWLVRVDDKPEHREWIARIAGDLRGFQHSSGGIREHLAGAGGGHYVIPQSNEAYGTGETPLIQSNDDLASDQLYSTGFGLLGLHEASAATGDAKLKETEDKLAEYLCRIQIRSRTLDFLDGAWFRAFDIGRWDFWASSADVGWGAWSVEAGWGQSWIAATLAMRINKTSLWDIGSRSQIARQLDDVRREMAMNSGGPWRPAAQP